MLKSRVNLGELTEEQRKIWNNGAPMAKRLMVVAIIGQIISGLTEVYGATKYFNEIIPRLNFPYYYPIVYTILGLLLIASFPWKMKGEEKDISLNRFRYTWMVLILMCMAISLKATIVLAISLVFGAALELLIKEGTWYSTTSLLNRKGKPAISSVISWVIVAALTVYFVDYSVNVSKNAVGTTFEANPPAPKLISKDYIIEERDIAIAYAESEYIEQYGIISTNHDTIVARQNSYYAAKIAPIAKNRDYYARIGPSKWRTKIKNLEKEIQKIEAEKQAVLLSEGSKFTKQYNELKSQKESLVQRAETKFDEQEQLINKKNERIESNNNKWNEVFGGVITTLSSRAIIISVCCYIWIAIFYARCGITIEVNPTKEFFEGALGGYLKELFEYYFIYSLRTWRNDIRHKMKKMPVLVDQDQTNVVFGERLFEIKENQQKVVKSEIVKEKGLNTSNIEKDSRDLDVQTHGKDSSKLPKEPSKKTVAQASKRQSKQASKKASIKKVVPLSISGKKDNSNTVVTVDSVQIHSKSQDSFLAVDKLSKKTVEIKVIGDRLFAMINDAPRDSSWVERNLKDRYSKLKAQDRNPETQKRWILIFELSLAAFEVIKKQKVENI